MGAVDTYTLEGKTKEGKWRLLYAGPAPGDRCFQELEQHAKEGRYLEFDVKRWDLGDVDGDSYTGDGQPMP